MASTHDQPQLTRNLQEVIRLLRDADRRCLLEQLGQDSGEIMIRL